MSLEGAVDRRKETTQAIAGGVGAGVGGSAGLAGKSNGNGVVAPPYPPHRLRLNPKMDHKPDSYEDLQLEFSPLLFSSLERYLPPGLLNVSRDCKLQYMREILLRYSPEGERNRLQRHREYRQRIISNFQPLHRELYTMHAANFFVPSFLRAINESTEESFRSIMSEPSPGIFTFEMLQPRFCEMLLSEVENFEKWVHETKFRIMRPNTMNKYGVVLDDFGFETMLDKLMEDFIRPISRVLFPEVGGSTLDSHHGFVLEYGMDRDVDLGFHVDDSEVTLNVCLGKQFAGGELFFRGVRCDKHVNTETQSEMFKWKFWIIPTFRDMQFFIVVVIDMGLELLLLGIGSTCFCGAEVLSSESCGNTKKIFPAGVESVGMKRETGSTNVLPPLNLSCSKGKENLLLELLDTQVLLLLKVVV